MENCEHIFFENRNIYVYSDIRNEDVKLFLVNDGDMIKRVQNNMFNKLEENSENIIVVAIEPEDRFNEYTPWFQNSYVDRIDVFKGSGDDYLELLMDELVPYIEEKEDVEIKDKNIFLAGASLGGLISSYGLLKYPKRLGGGIFVSSSYWYDGFLNYLSDSTCIDEDWLIYMDVGDKEKPGKITLFKDIVKETQKVYEILLEKGVKEKNINYRIQKDMGHNESFFIDRIYNGIVWISSKGSIGDSD